MHQDIHGTDHFRHDRYSDLTRRRNLVHSSTTGPAHDLCGTHSVRGAHGHLAADRPIAGPEF